MNGNSDQENGEKPDATVSTGKGVSKKSIIKLLKDFNAENLVEFGGIVLDAATSANIKI